MNIFYNEKGIGDTLIISIAESEETTFKTVGDAAYIYDAASNDLVGINLFSASTYLDINENGQVKMDQDKLAQVNAALEKNGLETPLVADFTPKFVVGFVEEKSSHPNADKLSICKINVGTENLQIVCGAPNIEAGQKVVVAKVGAVMPSGMIIKDAELRGVASSGMVCSAKELALPNAPEKKGILVLEDTAIVGEAFPMS